MRIGFRRAEPAVSLPPATQLIASHSPLPAEPITTPAVLFEVEAAADTLQYTDLFSKLSDDVYKRSYFVSGPA
ncbi:hypothetical protein WJX77_010829 [Trebouxia sp. C0004]